MAPPCSYLVLDLPGLGNGGHVRGCHQHPAQQFLLLLVLPIQEGLTDGLSVTNRPLRDRPRRWMEAVAGQRFLIVYNIENQTKEVNLKRSASLK
jgi:hypothetical protein